MYACNVGNALSTPIEILAIVTYSFSESSVNGGVALRYARLPFVQVDVLYNNADSSFTNRENFLG